ncbi:hypothetical protein P170DRAFT_429880 [Aspergillus steynii IBT 23096]|uniref:AB hydrolase-1 domain-containing protein n=1 Tax=Aspergillus steynii IBT 23096 TaxID=1392250 RepID=A0A2I2FX20_9EURO|nr:uncharacterized protein P170DRAFT_429880 [Aspergillus steynii IBT 23096]PLB45190.1 hypothetical protein P170DRAFT_429880 [Aspergillus steynii IBT 23096]
MSVPWSLDPPPAYEELDPSRLTPPSHGIGQSRFFRSTTSLTLDPSAGGDEKRRLLLIYVHGFMGSEESFQNFPKHVHDLLTISLGESHVIYTKVYPRYKTRGPIHVARDQFSQWLSPHEAPDLDIILLGHSLGGIISSEVALVSRNHRLKHRVLGLVNFDVPFLGLHPRVVATGIGSLFHRSPDDPSDPESTPSPGGFNVPDQNQTFDPAFSNDLHLARWKGWGGARHFISKYSENLSRSLVRYFFSYYDHAGCMNNYPELIKRHRKLLELEAIDDWNTPADSGVNRIRFVNYFTTSTGPAKKPKKGSAQDEHSRRESDTSSVSQTDTKSLESEQKPTTDYDKHDGVGTEHTQDHASNKNKGDGDREGDGDGDEENSPPKSLRKFCYLPKDSIKGRDDLWVPVLMEGVDEVVAHQSMFLPRNIYYDRLVGDTASRIESWIHDDLTKRAVLDGEIGKSAGVDG